MVHIDDVNMKVAVIGVVFCVYSTSGNITLNTNLKKLADYLNGTAPKTPSAGEHATSIKYATLRFNP